MAGKDIRSEDLTFWSFYHSQGNPTVQGNIFAYAWRTRGIVPILHPNFKEIKRYTHYLGTTKNQPPRHVEITNDNSTIEDSVEDSFVKLRKDLHRERKLIGRTIPQIITVLAHGIVHVENRLFDLNTAWVNADGLDRGRQKRLNQRVAVGRASLLLAHGRDQEPTGYTLFDDMYSEVWSQVEAADPEQDILGSRREMLIERVGLAMDKRQQSPLHYQ